MKASIMTVLLSCLLVALTSVSLAQQQTIVTTAGQIKLSELADPEMQYLFEGMQAATIRLKDGSETAGMANYNILLDAMEVTGRRGQPEALDPVRIEQGGFDQHRFVYVPETGYMELLSDEAGRVSLMQRRQVRLNVTPTARGAYGSPSTTSWVRAGSLSREYQTLDNPEGQELEISLRMQSYFVIVHEGESVTISNRRQLLRQFPQWRDALRRYTDDHDVDYSSREDLIGLVAFMNSL